MLTERRFYLEVFDQGFTENSKPTEDRIARIKSNVNGTIFTDQTYNYLKCDFVK